MLCASGIRYNPKNHAMSWPREITRPFALNLRHIAVHRQSDNSRSAQLSGFVGPMVNRDTIAEPLQSWVHNALILVGISMRGRSRLDENVFSLARIIQHNRWNGLRRCIRLDFKVDTEIHTGVVCLRTVHLTIGPSLGSRPLLGHSDPTLLLLPFDFPFQFNREEWLTERILIA